jgi:translation initiation factor 3 subunit M
MPHVRPFSSNFHLADGSLRLSNIFNVTPRSSPLRLQTYLAIVEIASKGEDYEALQLESIDFEKWLAECNVSVEEKASFLKSTITALVSSGKM